MKFPKFISLMVLGLIAPTILFANTAFARSSSIHAVSYTPSSITDDNVFKLADFGAVGDGVTDDGPALQNALNAIAAAGAGTLFVPGARYEINTPDQKDFTGLSASKDIILDRVDCVDSANRIRADAYTEKLSVINSVYTFLDSQSPQTKVITTDTSEADPVQYVSQQFNAKLGRDPDAATHFYWSDRMLHCDEDAVCITAERMALDVYLGAAPVPNFSMAGQFV